MSASAIDLIRQRLAASDPSDRLPAQAPSPNTAADPLGISSRSMYPTAPTRPDRSTVNPERGNRVFGDQLAVIDTHGNVGRRDHASPMGTDEP